MNNKNPLTLFCSTSTSNSWSHIPAVRSVVARILYCLFVLSWCSSCLLSEETVIICFSKVVHDALGIGLSGSAGSSVDIGITCLWVVLNGALWVAGSFLAVITVGKFVTSFPCSWNIDHRKMSQPVILEMRGEKSLCNYRILILWRTRPAMPVQ